VTTAGLGGGFWNEAPDRVSVTVDRDGALRTLRGIIAMTGAAQGRMSGHELLETLQSISQRALQMLDDTADYLDEDEGTSPLAEAYRREIAVLERDVKRATRGAAMYDAGTRYETHLANTLNDWMLGGHISEDDLVCGWTVGFTEKSQAFVQISIENLGIVRVAARREARPDIVAGECELRFKPEDLQIAGVLEVPKRMLRVLE
jgi:hypothetical protein